jgi:hypothetical protein
MKGLILVLQRHKKLAWAMLAAVFIAVGCYCLFVYPIPFAGLLVVGSAGEEVGLAGLVELDGEVLRVTLMDPQTELAAFGAGRLEVDGDDFIRLIDALGGVDLDIDQAIIYRDAEGEPYFQLDAGPAHLDGEASLYYLRYCPGPREDRLHRQQRFLTALAAKIGEKGLRELPRLVRLARDVLHIELDRRLILLLGRNLVHPPRRFELALGEGPSRQDLDGVR